MGAGHTSIWLRRLWKKFDTSSAVYKNNIGDKDFDTVKNQRESD